MEEEIKDLKIIVVLIGILQIVLFVMSTITLRNSLDNKQEQAPKVKVYNHIIMNSDDYTTEDESEEKTANI